MTKMSLAGSTVIGFRCRATQTISFRHCRVPQSLLSLPFGAGTAYCRNIESAVLGMGLQPSNLSYISEYMALLNATCIHITYLMYRNIIEHGQ